MSIKNNSIRYFVSIKVNGANPNGDPGNDNSPRTNTDGNGIISSFSIKYKIKKALSANGSYVSSISCVDNEIAQITQLERDFPDLLNGYRSSDIMDKDIGSKFFGSVLAKSGNTIEVDQDDETSEDNEETPKKKKGKGGKTKSNVEKGTSVSLRGCITVTDFKTDVPITIQRDSHTKSYNTQKDGTKKESSTAGAVRQTVDNAIYYGMITINHSQSNINGCNDDDIKKFEQALVKMFEYDSSASRPDGTMCFKQILKVDGKLKGDFQDHIIKKDGIFDLSKVKTSPDTKISELEQFV